MEGTSLSVGLLKRDNQTRVSVHNNASYPIWVLMGLSIFRKSVNFYQKFGILFSGTQVFPVFPKQGYEFPIQEIDSAIKGKKEISVCLSYQCSLFSDGTDLSKQNNIVFIHKPELKEWHLQYIGMPYNPPCEKKELRMVAEKIIELKHPKINQKTK